MELSRMPLGLMPAFDAFDILAKGRSEVFSHRDLSEDTRSMGPRLTNNGRKGAIEAVMIPRFISSLSLYMSGVTATHTRGFGSTHTAKTALTRLSSETLIRAQLGGYVVLRTYR